MIPCLLPPFHIIIATQSETITNPSCDENTSQKTPGERSLEAMDSHTLYISGRAKSGLWGHVYGTGSYIVATLTLCAVWLSQSSQIQWLTILQSPPAWFLCRRIPCLHVFYRHYYTANFRLINEGLRTRLG